MTARSSEALTQAYMETLSAAELTLSRAYTTGNHWLILWGLVVSALVTWIIVRSGVLDRVYRKLESRSRTLRVFLVGVTFLVVNSILSLPWSLYQGWWRETQYGRTSQPLGDFLAQGGMALVIFAVIGAFFLIGVYAMLRKAGRWWWAWSGLLVAAGAAFMLLLSPSLIEPLFNDFEPIPEGEVREAVLALAKQSGVPKDRVFIYDGSRQSENFTANVSGIGGSARIAISDVALGEASLDEVKAVTGHEVGHYVLGHVWRSLAIFAVLSMLLFWLVDKLYAPAARLFGSDAPLEDIRSVPVLAFLFGLMLSLAQPVTNTMTRIGEREADRYSLETVGLPDALASALIKTAEYRYPLAGPVEQAIFYTHPTVESRVRSAMEWKVANPDRDMGAGPASEP